MGATLADLDEAFGTARPTEELPVVTVRPPASPSPDTPPARASLADIDAALAPRPSAGWTTVETPRDQGRARAIEHVREPGWYLGTPLHAAVEGTNDSVYGNLRDMVGGAGAGIAGLVSGRGFSEPYSNFVEDRRGYREGLRRERPWSSLAGDLAGSTALAGLAMPMMTAQSALPVVRGGAGMAGWDRIGSIGQQGALGGLQGMWQGASQGEGAGRTTDALTQGAIGAAGAAGLEGLMRGFPATYNRFFGVRHGSPEGVSPQSNAIAFGHEGVTPTAGQTNRNHQQILFEERARQGSYGPMAQNIMQNADRSQAAQIARRQDELLADVGGAPIGRDTVGLPRVTDAIRAEADMYHTLASRGYERADTLPAQISGQDIAGLRSRVHSALESQGVATDPTRLQRLPATEDVLFQIGRLDGMLKDAAASHQGPLSSLTMPYTRLREIEKDIRRAVNSATSENDRWAALQAQKEFRAWVEDAIRSPYFQGDRRVLPFVQQANQDWARYNTIRYGDTSSPERMGQSTIARLHGENVTPELEQQLLGATNAVTSANRATSGLREVRDLLGANHPAVNQVRQQTLSDTLHPARGQGPQAQSTSITNMVDGRGRPVARELFDEGQLSDYRNHARVLGLVPTPRNATNPSRTAWETAGSHRMGAAAALGGLGILGGSLSSGHFDPKYAALGLLPYARNASGVVRALASTRPGAGVPPAYGPGPRVAGLAAAEVVPEFLRNFRSED